MIPMVLKAASRVGAAGELAKRGIHADKIAPMVAFPQEFYAEALDDDHDKIQRWFLESAHVAAPCPLGTLLFYRYGDDA